MSDDSSAAEARMARAPIDGPPAEGTAAARLNPGARAGGGEGGAAESEDGADGEPSGDESPEGRMSSKGAKNSGESRGSFWKELPILIIVALVLAFVIKTWVVQPFYIPSKSMEDTLLVGDRVLVSKFIYQFRDIERGDIVVFNGTDSWDEDGVVEQAEPANPVAGMFTWLGQTLGLAPSGKDYIKRVIGLPGDTVECCDAEGRLLVNGEPLDEPYLYSGSLEQHMEFGPVTVEEGRLWVMGDHRSISYDSRTHGGADGDGSISEESVLGYAFVTVWPFDRFGSLSDD
jgi:signal peptidase I